MSEEAGAPNSQNQTTKPNLRTCGAACLSMVYRSLGKDIQPDEIWPAISKPNSLGSLSSTTHLMAQDALKRGFRALAVQTRHPLQVLRQCRAFGVSAILNHRIQIGSSSGHYSVLVDINADHVVLNDPAFASQRTLSHLELMELWVPLAVDSEISGNVLIAISKGGGPPATPIICPNCTTSLQSVVECPKCKTQVSLRPRAVLACVNASCLSRLWNRICCPACDYLWDFAPKTGNDTEAAKASEASNTGVDLPKTIAAIDKFTDLVTSIPQAAIHPDLRKQLEFFASSKQHLKTAVARDLAQRALMLGQIAELKQSVEQKRSQQQKKSEELNQPMSPLDGNELGWALLRNLGLA